MTTTQGWHGWDQYAAFYDWENARTMGRRDVHFWRGYVLRIGGPVLELGCGTGRITLPLARAGVPIVGLDRSAQMLARARRRLRRAGVEGRACLVRGDIRQLPFTAGRATSVAVGDSGTRKAGVPGGRRSQRAGGVSRTARTRASGGPFRVVLAPYGILQSLLTDRDLDATLAAAAGALAPGGRLGVDLVPDVPRWPEYERRVTLRGHRGSARRPAALVESVRQDPRRRLTTFEHEYTEGSGRARTTRRFTVTFRTLPIPAMRRRLERAGFRVDAVLGDYEGRPWDDRAESWIILATRT